VVSLVEYRMTWLLLGVFRRRHRGVASVSVWQVRARPGCIGKWVTLSTHDTYAAASRAWFGWMTLVHTNNNEWFIRERKGPVAKRTDNPALKLNPFVGLDDGRDPKALLAELESRGVRLMIDGDNLRRAEGQLQPGDREAITACKVELMILLRAREGKPPSAWDEASANRFIREARVRFRDLWEELSSRGEPLTNAALAVLCDAAAMLAESVSSHNLDAVRAKASYCGWICDRVREQITTEKTRGVRGSIARRAS